MCLLAGLKRKYHSNQLEKVNMITSRVNTVCAFLCWYTSFIQFIWSMQQVAAEHQLVQQLLPLQKTAQKKIEELVETKSAKALLIMPTVTTALHEQKLHEIGYMK